MFFICKCAGTVFALGLCLEPITLSTHGPNKFPFKQRLNHNRIDIRSVIQGFNRP